jgi:hypothetical protein
MHSIQGIKQCGLSNYGRTIGKTGWPDLGNAQPVPLSDFFQQNPHFRGGFEGGEGIEGQRPSRVLHLDFAPEKKELVRRNRAARLKRKVSVLCWACIGRWPGQQSPASV